MFCRAPLGRAMTCFLIMITRYAAYLCFLDTILNSFYVGRYPLYIDKRMNRLLTIVIIVIAVCSRCVFGHYFAINITIEHFVSIRELISFINYYHICFRTDCHNIIDCLLKHKRMVSFSQFQQYY
jgi:hypothetical protein